MGKTRRNGKGKREWGNLLRPKPNRRGFGIRWPDPTTKCGYRERWGIPSEKDAHAILDKLRVESFREAEGLAPKRIVPITFEAFVDKALELKKAEWDSEGTATHAFYVLGVAKEFFGKTKVHAIDVPAARKYVAFLRTERGPKRNKCKPNTIHRIVSLFSGLWKYALEGSHTTKNPWKVVKKDLLSLKKCQPPIDYIGQEKLNKVYEAVPATRGAHKKSGYRPIIELMANTGLRRGEMWNLRWEDVDVDLKWIHVRETKTRKDRLFTAITPRAKEILSDLRALYADKHEYVVGFLGVKKDSATRVFGDYMESAGIEGVTLHKLRNAWAIGAMEAGAPATWIMEQGGWSKLETLQLYAQWAPENSGKRLAERLGQHWGQGADNNGESDA